MVILIAAIVGAHVSCDIGAGLDREGWIWSFGTLLALERLNNTAQNAGVYAPAFCAYCGLGRIRQLSTAPSI